ncbi:hypothetical protein GCM10009801_66380 [Streptomyces albiaxialis]|uniref:Uncharacterized protein n=1 Tax=Streptomyces albiaxialis TaxID=329523 RepID=A0ABN2WPP7_9ACTN
MTRAVGTVGRLWAAGQAPFRDGLYRPDGTALDVHVEGPGEYHRDAGQPVPFRLGEPFDVARAIEEYGTFGADVCFEEPLPDGSGWLTGGGGGMGNIGWLARLGADRSPVWIATMFLSNPFLEARCEGTRAHFTNDWRNVLTLDLADPALA